jgi:hypothetical protein
MALASCTFSRPPQTGFYCIDIPNGRSAEASRFVQSVADRLNFKVSEAQFPSEKGPPNHTWEVYGGGVSMFVGTAMKDGKPDRFGNVETTFDPNRLDVNVAKTGLWQRVRFEDVVRAASDAARELGWPLSKAAAGESCST